eukprot:COSAG02_NODE_47864_length_338_cov_0.648536_1_plen_38_part_10
MLARSSAAADQQDGVGVCCDAGARRCDMIGSLSLSLVL